MISKITLGILVCCTLATTANAQQRLLAKMYAEYDPAGNKVKDSTYYFHSGSKGVSAGKYKIPEFEVMDDSSYIYEEDNGQLKLAYKTISTYTGTDLQQTTQFELDNSTWKSYRRTIVVYKGGKPDTVKYDTWQSQGGGSWRNSSRIIYTWSGNNVATALRQARSFGRGGGGGNWEDSYLKTYTYAGSDVKTYVYQRPKGGNLADTLKIEYTYSGGKKTQTDRYLKPASTWEITDKTYHTYDASNRVVVDSLEYIVGSTWEKGTKYAHYYSGANKVEDSIIRIDYQSFSGGYARSKKQELKANGENKWTEERTMSWDGINKWQEVAAQDSTNRWYYGWNLSVDDQKMAVNNVEVYPSPANNTINIKLSGIENGTKLNYVIFDMAGRLMKNWSSDVKEVTTVSVEELGTGNYVLLINDGTHTSTEKFVIAK